MTKDNVATKVESKEEEVIDQSAGVEVAPKRKGRGVASAKGTSLKKYHESDACTTNGLFTGCLKEVKVDYITIGEDTTGLPSFTGMVLPKLVMHFESPHAIVTDRRNVPLQFTPVESTILTIPGGKEEWKVNLIFDWMKHILDVYVMKGKEMTDEIADALSLPFEDFDENGEFVVLDAQTIVDGWKQLFTNFVNIMNGGEKGKPVYKAADGKPMIVWMKLLRYTKIKGNWRAVVGGKSTEGDLGFPSFVGEGCIELFAQGKAPNIKIDVTKESIRPQSVAKKPTAPSMPGIGGAPGMGGIPVDAGIGGMPMDAGMDMSGGFEGGMGGMTPDMPF